MRAEGHIVRVGGFVKGPKIQNLNGNSKTLLLVGIRAAGSIARWTKEGPRDHGAVRWFGWLVGAVSLGKILPSGVSSGFRPVGRTGLVEYVGYMMGNGVWADEQLLAYFRIAFA